MTKQFIYEAVGTTRQAHAAYCARRARHEALLDGAEAQLQTHRRDHPGLGLQKAWRMIRPVGVSRTRFCDEMTWRGHALDIKRSFIRVTRSGSYRYPNLVKRLIINAPNQVWQSDTTYYRIREKYYYLTFIIDVYSRYIVGAYASRTLLAEANIQALERALRNCGQHDLSGLIFHSDGGAQFRSKRFVEALRQRGISSSMCEVALDNAYAERINGVIKQEYLDHWEAQTFEQLRSYLRRAVHNYNTRRSHGELPGQLCPEAFTKSWHAAIASCRYALRIKDGQNINPVEALDGKNFPTPGKYADDGRGQILPADVIFLPIENKKLLCTRA